jgi:hypothetical protein
MSKTIEISDEMYGKLIELATEMTTQDPRCTRMPHMFQIRDWKKLYDADLSGDTLIWLDRVNGIEIETIEQLIDYMNDTDIEFVEDDIKEMWDYWKHYNVRGLSDLKDWLEERVPDLEEYSYSLVPEYTNCFLTAKAAEEHLKLNHYHYHANADVYLNHAWRNPEAELVSTFLCNLIGKDLHT